MTRTFGNPLLSHSPNDFHLEVADDCFFLLWCDSITSPFLYWSVALWPAARTECSWDDGVFGPCGDLPSLPESSAGVRVQLIRELLADGHPTQAGRASCEEPHNYCTKETKTGSGLWHRISTGKLFSLFYANMFSFFMNTFLFSFFFKINHNSWTAESHEAWRWLKVKFTSVTNWFASGQKERKADSKIKKSKLYKTVVFPAYFLQGMPYLCNLGLFCNQFIIRFLTFM